MARNQPSIINDILGPLMIGPSSSHTCGPSRIGFLARQLLPGELSRAVITFARLGSFAQMYRGHRSDVGFVNGLLGRRPEDVRLCDSIRDARAAGVDIRFVIEDFPPPVPNIVHLLLENTQGQRVLVHADSTGGGTVKLLQVDGYAVSILGDCYELIVRTPYRRKERQKLLEMLSALWPANEGCAFSETEQGSLINIKLRQPCGEDLLQTIRRMESVSSVLVMEPILTVPSNCHGNLPFATAEELLARSEESGRHLWELALEYETVRSGWSRQQILDYVEYVVRVMEDSARQGMKGERPIHGIIRPAARQVDGFIRENPRALDMGVLNTAVPWALGVMEHNSAAGLVVCAPTGGSAGVFPGAVLGVANHLGLSMEEKVRAVLTTGVVGVVIARQCNFSAELYGCQVEPGAAAGMAAAGLVHLMGGNARQACMAASCAIQNILGTICDPVAGLVQIPCINRNAMAVANAVVCANMILGGFDPLIPLDQTVETMVRCGRQLPRELRCTCDGGLCITPRGRELAVAFGENH